MATGKPMVFAKEGPKILATGKAMDFAREIPRLWRLAKLWILQGRSQDLGE